jgi:hypothetical protein
MTLTIDVSPETIRRIAEDPERLAHVARMVEAAYGVEPEPVKVSKELYDSLMDDLDKIESGEAKVGPWDSEARRKRSAELLKREFGYDPASKTEKAA